MHVEVERPVVEVVNVSGSLWKSCQVCLLLSTRLKEKSEYMVKLTLIFDKPVFLVLKKLEF